MSNGAYKLWLVCALCGCQAGDYTMIGEICAPIGCGPNAILTLPIVGDASQLANGTARACRNDQCAEGSLPSVLPSPGGGGSGTGGNLTGAFSWSQLMVWDRTPLEVEVHIYDDSTNVADGDQYTLTLRSPNDSVVVEGRWTARYKDSTPSAACGLACLTAQLECTGACE